MTTQAPLPRMHLLKEVAETYQLSLLSLQRWARRDDCFTHIKIGKQRFLTDEQVVALLKASTVTASKDDKRAADMAGVADRQSHRKPPQGKAA